MLMYGKEKEQLMTPIIITQARKRFMDYLAEESF